MIDISLFKQDLEIELSSVLKFWSTKGINPDSQQFYGEISGAGIPVADANKGIVMYSRIMWTFAAAARFYKDDSYLKTANIARMFIESSFFDSANGGYFWEVSSTGVPTINKKQVYAQAFVIYAYSEYYLATKDNSALNRAMDVFNLLEENCYDSKFGGYFEAYSAEWSKLADVRLSERDMNEPKGMNTNLHILEAYTTLFEATKSEKVGKALEKLIVDFNKNIIDDNGHVTIFFSEDWKPKTHEYSYGHDIETSWLIWDAAVALGNQSILNELKPVVLNMVDVFLNEGYDHENNAAIYEYNTKTKHYDTDRHWWVQVETMEGLANAYKLTGEKHLFEKVFKTWKYISAHIVDRENGEWFWRVDKNDKPYLEDQKQGMWKCPYHNGRALMRIIEKLRAME